MKTIDIHGKPYVMVKDRIIHFNATYPNGRISTTMIPLEGKYAFKAEAIPDVANHDRYFTGHAEEEIGSSQINKTSALENCETSAIGRALGCMGIGVDESFASGNEVENAIHQQDNIENKDTKLPDHIDRATRQNPFECPKCGSGVFDNRVKDVDGNMVINEKRHPAFKCKDRDCNFATWETDSMVAGVMPSETLPPTSDEDQRHYEEAMAETKQKTEDMPQ